MEASPSRIALFATKIYPLLGDPNMPFRGKKNLLSILQGSPFNTAKIVFVLRKGGTFLDRRLMHFSDAQCDQIFAASTQFDYLRPQLQEHPKLARFLMRSGHNQLDPAVVTEYVASSMTSIRPTDMLSIIKRFGIARSHPKNPEILKEAMRHRMDLFHHLVDLISVPETLEGDEQHPRALALWRYLKTRIDGELGPDAPEWLAAGVRLEKPECALLTPEKVGAVTNQARKDLHAAHAASLKEGSHSCLSLVSGTTVL